MNTENTASPKDQLVSDLKRVMSDAEQLLHATAGQASTEIAGLRARIQETLASARVNLADAQAVVVDKAKEAGRVADDYVHDNPWKAVGVAAGVGLIVGLLIGRR
jgi:ElaB/YqjD/DUF883 family membrane-anchored ribosome-binding protein